MIRFWVNYLNGTSIYIPADPENQPEQQNHNEQHHEEHHHY